jgi:outer membrane protein assembly factor BamB
VLALEPHHTARPIAGPRVTAAVHVGGRPNAMVAAGGHVWIGDFHDRRLTAIDPRSGTAIPGLRPRIGDGVQELRAAGGVLYALVPKRRRIVRLDPATGRPLGRPIAIPPDATAFTATPGTLWVSVRVQNAGHGDELERVDARTGRVRARYVVRDSIGGLELAHGALWMISPRPATLVRFDLATTRRRHIELDGNRPGRIVAAEGALWVTLTDTDQIARVDARTGNVATVAVGRAPVGLVVHGGRVWVADRASSALTRIDVATNRPGGEVLVSTNPSELVAAGGDLWTGSLATGTVVRVTDRGA